MTQFRFGDERDWFFEKRFGMFVHWGIYAIPAWHEQIQWRKEIPRKEYIKLIDQFNPTEFDPEAWLDLAESAGMKYIAITTKHHDGFCLWDTKQTDFNVMNSPYGKDIIGMVADACHRRDIPLCLYYSVVDWHHPNYPNQNRSHELAQPEEGDEPDFDKYMEFLRAQVTELCTNYGKIHCFWWDMNMTEVKDPSVNNMIRELQPGILINPRGFDEGDFGTPERDYEAVTDETFDRPVEACQAVGSHSWGYKEDEDYYSDRHLIHSIDKFLARGANYLLNVGPKADGTISEESVQILKAIGEWYGQVKESLLDATLVSGMTDNDGVLLTRKDNTLYVHMLTAPTTSSVSLAPMKILPRKATLMNTGEELEVRVETTPYLYNQPEYLRLRGLPVNDLSGTVMVAKLEFDEL